MNRIQLTRRFWVLNWSSILKNMSILPIGILTFVSKSWRPLHLWLCIWSAMCSFDEQSWSCMFFSFTYRIVRSTGLSGKWLDITQYNLLLHNTHRTLCNTGGHKTMYKFNLLGLIVWNYTTEEKTEPHKLKQKIRINSIPVEPWIVFHRYYWVAVEVSLVDV